MRIAHASATYPPYRGGTGQVCFDQARYLSARGHEVTIYCPVRERRDTVDLERPRVVRLAAWLRLGNAALVPGHLGIDRPDLLHLHYPYYGGGDLAWLDTLLRHIPYVVTYHQDVVLPGVLGIVARRHHALLGRRILGGARLVMATSLDYARHSRLAPLLRQNGTVVELPNGVDVDRFRPVAPDGSQPTAPGSLPNEHRVLFVGSLDHAHFFKGLDVLFRAVARLGELPVRVIVVGRGELLAEYQRQAALLGIAGRVRFDPDISDEELPAQYRQADVLVLPSVTGGEAFGLVLLEAMASGVPVIASDLPGVRTVVRRTGGGLLVPPGDAAALAGALRLLLSDNGRRRALGLQGRAAVERLYAWPRVIDDLECLYQRAVGGGSA